MVALWEETWYGPIGAERTKPEGGQPGKVKRNGSERTRWCEIKDVGKDGGGIKSRGAAGWKKKRRKIG